MTPGRNDPCSCGSGKKFKKCCGLAAASQSPHSHPSQATAINIPATLQRAVELHRAGHLIEAEALYSQVLAAHTKDPGAWYLAGSVAHRLGKTQQAIEFVSRAITLKPNEVVFHYTLANAFNDCGQLADAVSHFKRCLALDANFTDAIGPLADLYRRLGNFAEAETFYHRLLQIEAPNPFTPNALGTVLERQGKFDDAIQCFQSALQIDPSFFSACFNLGSLYWSQGEARAAVEYYEKGLALHNDDGIKITARTLFPLVPQSIEEIASIRTRLDHNLDTLLKEDLHFDDLNRHVNPANFYLAYHGLNDRQLKTRLAKVYEKACPSLRQTAPHCVDWTGPGESSDNNSVRKIRIGFASRYLRFHSVGRTIQGLIRHLPRERYHVSVFAYINEKDQPDALTHSIRQSADHFVALDDDLAQARRTIAAQQLDILFYPDIGMEQMNYFLAFSRLAPIQCVSWGHLSTSGIDTVDYYISHRDWEPDNGQQYYTEQLLLMKDCAIYPMFERPVLRQPKTRAQLGLNDAAHLYACPQSLFKIHPDCDAVFAEILARDPAAQLLLFEGDRPHWRAQLLQRFAKSMPQHLERIQFVPQQDIENFYDFIAASDVVLDSLHVGGGVTTMDVFATGTPIVTLPTENMRSRFTAACYRRMGIEESIAASTAGYVEIALRLANDRSRQEKLRAQILERSACLYHDTSGVHEFARLFEMAIAAKMNQTHPKASIK